MFVCLKERKKLVGFIFVIVIEFSKIKITEIFQKNIFQNSVTKLEQEREFYCVKSQLHSMNKWILSF